MESKQIQKGGENAQQIQVGTFINQIGITEQRAREIYTEMSAAAIKENTLEAESIAHERINMLESFLIPRIEKEDAIFECFADPAFQVLIKKAQMTSVCTEREADYKILSELLAHRVKNKNNIKKKASISKAVEIIDQIDDDSLLALTVFLSMMRFTPNDGHIPVGLQVISTLYEKLDLDKLPHDEEWIDNLSILGAVSSNRVGTLKKYEDFLSERLPGYVSVGIDKSSDIYPKAIDLLNSCGLQATILEDNILLDGYVRLPVRDKTAIRNIRLYSVVIDDGKLVQIKQPLNEQQIYCLNQVYDMYTHDPRKHALVKHNFSELLHSYPAIHKAIVWWNSISILVSLTSIGNVIGHTNAKSIDPNLPDLD